MTAVQDPPLDPGPPTEQIEPVNGNRGRRPRRVRRLPRAGWVTPERGSAGWIVTTSLFWLAAVSVSFGIFAVALTPLRYAAFQKSGFDELHRTLAEGTAPVSQLDPDGKLVPIGSPVALISIPRIGLRNVVVVEGTSSQTLERGPGHQRDTRFPGQAGRSVLQGRSGAYGGPFGKIDQLRTGDPISIITGQGTSNYVVTGHRRAGDPTPAISAGQGQLALVTASGLPFVPGGVLYVDAKLVGAVKDPSSVVARDLPAEEKPMGTMPDSLPVTILALQGVLIVVVAAVACWYRWGRNRTWLVFGPLVLLAVALVGGRVMLLLPNLL